MRGSCGGYVRSHLIAQVGLEGLCKGRIRRCTKSQSTLRGIPFAMSIVAVCIEIPNKLRKDSSESWKETLHIEIVKMMLGRPGKCTYATKLNNGPRNAQRD